MNLKRAKELLDQVNNLGNSNPIAQQLTKELESYIKSAKIDKKSYLTSFSSGEYGKTIFAYWATAALIQLKSEGAESLQDIDLLTPNPGETAHDFGKRVLRATPKSEGRRVRRRDVDTQSQIPDSSHGKLITTLWSKIGGKVTSGVNNALSAIETQYSSEKVTTSASGAVTYASNWSLALDGHGDYDRDFNAKKPNPSSFPYARIQASTSNTGDLSKDVFQAIKEGIFAVLKMKKRWVRTQEEKGLTMDTLQRSVGDEGKTLEDLIANPTETLGSPEELKKLEFMFFDNQFDHDPDLFAEVRDLLVKAGVLTLTQAEGQQLKAQYENGEFDDNETLKENTKDLLINENWIEDTFDLTTSVEEAVNQIDQTAQNTAVAAAATANLPENDELKSNLKELLELNLTIENLKSVSLKLNMPNFHWLYDAHLYLEEDWVHVLREFDGQAMTLLNHAIETQKQPVMAVGLRYLLNDSTFASIAEGSKLRKIKYFADNCMDQKLLKTALGGPGVSLWYILCALTAQPISVQMGGSKGILNSGVDTWSGKVMPFDFFTLLCNKSPEITKSEESAIVNTLYNLTSPIVPSAASSKLKKNIEKIVGLCMIEGRKIDPKTNKPRRGEGARDAKANSMGNSKQIIKMRSFFGVVASELVRYRFYMDLKIDQSATIDASVPKTLGKSDCDDNVRSLMGTIPNQILDNVKTTMYEDLLAPEWVEEVQESIDNRIKLQLTKQKKLTSATAKLFEAFGIQAGDPLYEAYMPKD